MNVQHFTPGATATLSVTTSSGRVQFNGVGSQIEIQNGGSAAMFVKLGDSTVTAAVTDYPVLAGQSKLITRDPATHTHIAAITGTGTTTGYATVGDGA